MKPPGSLPEKGARIVVAMSGGVDSSVAAAWLKQQGYDVIGISLQLHDAAENVSNKFGTCCSLSDIADARRVAETMGFPFYVSDMEEKFQEAVIEDFLHEYVSGRTPNPCVRCNQKVKFRHLMDWALDLGAKYLATGHYANVRYNVEREEYELVKGNDPEKDQSYFLFPILQSDLAHTIFPVGSLVKNQVRELAEKLELGRVATKPDSQEICFVQDRKYKDYIEDNVAKDLLRPGHIADKAGRVFGEHTGIHQYTVGQRKGLGIKSTDPYYVTKIDRKTNTVFVGHEEELYSKKCLVNQLNWITEPHLHQAPKLHAKIRYRAKESPATIRPLLDNQIEVTFDIGQRALTPGQALVLYRDDVVVGGGWIDEVLA